MAKTYAEQILELENKILDKQLEIKERNKDAPETVVSWGQGKYRLTRGSQISDSRCEQPFAAGGCGALGGDYFSRQREIVSIWKKKNITPLSNQIDGDKKKIEILKEKQSMPYLRNELLSTSQQLQELEKNDPSYRQKKIDLGEELFNKAKKIDELEKKYQLFGNIPSLKPEIITPDPVVRTKTELGAINTRPLIIGGIVGLAALFLIWRFK